MSPHRGRLLGAALIVATGCAGAEKRPASAAFSEAPTTGRLVILHASDTESELLPESDGSGGIARFASILAALRRGESDPVIAVAAGDTFMPAPPLQLELDGANPVAAANRLLGWQASTLGNHEFDRGEAFLAEMIRTSGIPYVTATVDFRDGPVAALEVEPGATAPWLASHQGRVLPRGRLCAGTLADGRCDGLTVGVVGATTESLRSISSSSVSVGVPADPDALRGQVQEQVDLLRGEGVEIVVLLSHLQDVRRELALVEDGLTGVDVIVSGGGDDRLADAGDRLLPGHAPSPVCEREASCYPIVRTARDGRPVLVVATDGQHAYVGRLAVGFDAAGVLTGFDGASQPWPVDAQTSDILNATPAPAAAEIETRVGAALAGALVPVVPSTVLLDGEREHVRNRQTNLGDLSADSMVHAARAAGHEVAFALRNGGGIRASIDPRAAGEIRLLDLRDALRFDNPIVVVRTTRRVLVETLESSLRGVGTGRGHFPQVSDEVELAYDPSLPEGHRIRTLRIAGEELVREGKLLEPDAPATFATLDYLARGSDGWFPGTATSLAVIELPIREQAAVRDWLAELESRGAWKSGAAYPDRPGTRIRALP